MTDNLPRTIIRIANTDLDGSKSVYHALRKISGIGYMFSNAVLSTANVSIHKKVGELSEEEVKKIEAVIKDPIGHGLPNWIVNRRKDTQDTKDRHLISTDLKFRRDFDIRMMQKIRSYKGVRHAIGQPVRGQRTKAHFRKEGAVGVQRAKVKPGVQTKEDKKGREKK